MRLIVFGIYMVHVQYSYYIMNLVLHKSYLQKCVISWMDRIGFWIVNTPLILLCYNFPFQTWCLEILKQVLCKKKKKLIKIHDDSSNRRKPQSTSSVLTHDNQTPQRLPVCMILSRTTLQEQAAFEQQMFFSVNEKNENMSVWSNWAVWIQFTNV